MNNDVVIFNLNNTIPSSVVKLLFKKNADNENIQQQLNNLLFITQ